MKYTIMKERNTKGCDCNCEDDYPNFQALQDTMYVIGGKWRLQILYSICSGNCRFREIERSIPGLTTRMLSKELKAMELNNLITRTVHATSPNKIIYEETEYCDSLAPVFEAMVEWGQKHKKGLGEIRHKN